MFFSQILILIFEAAFDLDVHTFIKNPFWIAFLMAVPGTLSY